MGDLIDRQAAIDNIKELFRMGDCYCDKYSVIGMLNQLPSAEPERKKGKWERHNTYHGDDTSGFVDPDWRCSECGKQATVNEWMMYDLSNFCSNCGADMRGEE